MQGYGPDSFGALNAAIYDAEDDPGTTAEAVALLAGLAAGRGRVLDLAIGTGRVAWPLAARGAAVAIGDVADGPARPCAHAPVAAGRAGDYDGRLPARGETAVRAEIENLSATIEESLALLRRRL